MPGAWQTIATSFPSGDEALDQANRVRVAGGIPQEPVPAGKEQGVEHTAVNAVQACGLGDRPHPRRVIEEAVGVGGREGRLHAQMVDRCRPAVRGSEDDLEPGVQELVVRGGDLFEP